MIIESRAVPPFFKNGFLVVSPASREAILIDPGDEIPQLLDIAAGRRLTVKAILLTHAHMDHVAGVEAARRATGAPVGVHRDDLFLYEAAREQGRMFGYDVETPRAPDFFLEAGQRLSWDGLQACVHHTPGHSPGGVCLEIGPAGDGRTELFVGDTLFAGSIGRTDLPRGDYGTLIASIRNVLFAFADDTVVHPGHGEDTTIGAERRTNPFLR
jgi:glyoxylase-like metal-dependent hydrolase (beta-lactamase superfamily II)